MMSNKEMRELVDCNDYEEDEAELAKEKDEWHSKADKIQERYNKKFEAYL